MIIHVCMHLYSHIDCIIYQSIYYSEQYGNAMYIHMYVYIYTYVYVYIHIRSYHIHLAVNVATWSIDIAGKIRGGWGILCDIHFFRGCLTHFLSTKALISMSCGKIQYGTITLYFWKENTEKVVQIRYVYIVHRLFPDYYIDYTAVHILYDMPHHLTHVCHALPALGLSWSRKCHWSRGLEPQVGRPVVLASRNYTLN